MAISRDQIGLRFGLTPVKDDRVVAATAASDFQLNERAIVDKKKIAWSLWIINCGMGFPSEIFPLSYMTRLKINATDNASGVAGPGPL